MGRATTLGGTRLLAADIAVQSTGVMRFETRPRARHVPSRRCRPRPSSPCSRSHQETDIDLNTPAASLVGAHTKLVAQIFTDLMMTLIANNPNPENASSATVQSGGRLPIAKRSPSWVPGWARPAGLPANTGLGAAFATIVTEVGSNVTVSESAAMWARAASATAATSH